MNVKFILFYFQLVSFVEIKSDSSCLTDKNFQDSYLSYTTNIKTNNTWSIFSHFDTFSQLECATTCTAFPCFNITNFLLFIPNKYCFLDTSFSFKKMLTFKQTNSIAWMQFWHIKGFDIHLDMFYMPLKLAMRDSYLLVSSSFLYFYSNGERIDECSMNA